MRRRSLEHVSAAVHSTKKYLRKWRESRTVPIREFWSAEERIPGGVNFHTCGSAEIQRPGVVSTEVKFQSEPVIQVIRQRSASAVELFSSGDHRTRPEI